MSNNKTTAHTNVYTGTFITRVLLIFRDFDQHRPITFTKQNANKSRFAPYVCFVEYFRFIHYYEGVLLIFDRRKRGTRLGRHCVSQWNDTVYTNKNLFWKCNKTIKKYLRKSEIVWNKLWFERLLCCYRCVNRLTTSGWTLQGGRPIKDDHSAILLDLVFIDD